MAACGLCPRPRKTARAPEWLLKRAVSRARQSGTIPVAGERVGGFVLLDTIGVGGMATVWRAQDVADANRVVALKILHQARVSGEETRRMRREFLTLERLDHAHVVKVLDHGQHGGFPWLALQYVPGSDLGKRIEAWKTAPPPDRFQQVERTTRALCDALAYVHAKGIIHRDLKPANVLVDESGFTWLTDFGGVKDAENFSTNLTVAGRLVGTVAFMAPEQITGEPVDSRADLYGLGALMYAMLTGRRPVVADSIAGYLARQLAEMPKPPIEIDPSVPPRLDRVCMRLLQKEPAARFATARDVLTALDLADDRGALPLHGQSEAVSRMDERLKALARGVSGCVLLVGARGSGRSRMLSEVAGRAEGLGISVGWGASAAQASVCLVDDADEAPDLVREAVAERAEAAVSGKPLLLVMAGTDANHPHMAQLAGGLPIEDVTLMPLDRDALRALIRDHGAGGGLGAALTRRLGTELHGLPGATVAQLHALVEAGWLASGTDGNLKAVRTIDQLRVDPLPLPAAERHAVAARLGALSRDERRVIEAVAVLAMPTSAQVIGQTAQVAKAEPVIERLARSGWVAVRDEGLQQLVELASARAGQAVREALGPSAMSLHAAAAAALKERYGQKSSAISALVAHHLERAGRPTEARPLFLQAAQASLRRGDAADARAFAERTLALEPAQVLGSDDIRMRLAARVVLAEALRTNGRLGHARKTLRDALAIAGGATDVSARLRCTLGLVAVACGDDVEALGELAEGLRTLPQGDPAWPEACHALAGAAARAGRLDDARKWWHRLAIHGTETRNAVAELLAQAGLAEMDGAAPVVWEQLLVGAMATQRPVAVLEVGARLALLRLREVDSAGAAAVGERIAEFAEKRPGPEVESLAAAIHGRLAAQGGETTVSTEARMAFDAAEWKHALVAAVWNG